MKLDRNTYEAWLLDRAEGMLTPQQEQILDAFLKANPDLDLPGGALPKVEGGDAPFLWKDSLLRTIPPFGKPDAARSDDFLAARLEGDLSEEQELELDHYLYDHPEAARDARLMAHARIPSDPQVFRHKDRLEKQFPPTGMPDSYRLMDFLIAASEGDLSAEQVKALEQYLQERPEARREQALVEVARIKAGAETYPWKQELLKRDVRVLPLWTRWAAAASVTLLLGLGWWILQRERQGDMGIALQPKPAHSTTIEKAKHPVGQTDPVKQDAHEAAALPNTGSGAPAVDTGVPSAPRDTAGNMPRQTKPGQAAPVQEEPTAPRSKPVVVPEIPPVEELPVALDHLPLPSDPAPSELALAASPAPEQQSGAAGGESVDTYLANKLRGDVLDAPKRQAGLDGADLLAMADRALGAVTNGQGGVHMERGKARERIRFKLGRNFSVSASRGR